LKHSDSTFPGGQKKLMGRKCKVEDEEKWSKRRRTERGGRGGRKDGTSTAGRRTTLRV